MNTANPSGDSDEPSKLVALPPPADTLGNYVRLQDVLRRLPVTDKTLMAWAEDPDHPCPPVYDLGPRTRVMDAAAVEDWIRSRAVCVGETDAPDA